MGPKKNRGGGTGWLTVLLWFLPGNRPPFRLLAEYGGRRVSWALGWRFFDGGFAAVEGSAGGMSFDGCGSYLVPALGTGRPLLVGFLSFDSDLWGSDGWGRSAGFG